MTSKLSLYDIAANHRVLVDELTAADLDEQAIADTLAGESSFEDKLTATAYAVRSLEAMANQIKEAEQSMADRRKTYEKRVQNLREYMHGCMNLAGVRKVERPEFVMSIKTNPPAVQIIDPDEVPAVYMVTPEPTPRPDKKAIKEAIERGEEVPGCVMSQAERLEIK